MRIIQQDTIDPELLREFASDFRDVYAQCESCLIQLEHKPDDDKLLGDLAQAIDYLRDDLNRVGLAELRPLLATIGEILAAVRANKLSYNDMLCDVVLLSLEALHALVEENIWGAPSAIDKTAYRNICRALRDISREPAERKNSAVYKALLTLDPETNVPAPESLTDAFGTLGESAQTANRHLMSFGVAPDADLDFLASLVPALEYRSSYWIGRTQRIAQMALTMNEYAERCVDPTQLLAAVYAHDVAMSFLPLDVLHKKGQFSNLEREQVQGHVQLAYELLRRLGAPWESAAEIVLQHHERCDGRGYPKCLDENAICDGAKIIAIADAFDACKYGRAHRTELHRPLVRSLLEVNRNAGSQFSAYWVEVFNQVVKKSELLH